MDFFDVIMPTLVNLIPFLIERWLALHFSKFVQCFRQFCPEVIPDE
jgi:hypothetical protein